MYGDLSAASGLNRLTRDKDHARGFIQRHQDKLLYGSDCSDLDGKGSKCSGAQMIAAISGSLLPRIRLVSRVDQPPQELGPPWPLTALHRSPRRRASGNHQTPIRRCRPSDE